MNLSALFTPTLSENTLPPLRQIGAQVAYLTQALETYPSILVPVSDRKVAEVYRYFFKTFGVSDTVFYPTPSLSPYEWSGEERLSCQKRHQIRYQYQHTDRPPRVLLCTYKAFTHLLMDNAHWYKHTKTFYPGEKLPPHELVQQLIQMGYQPVGGVESVGDFSRRGSVLDVYPVGGKRVYRIEWFDDEIETIKSYNLKEPTLKPQAITHADIPPAYEWVIPTNYELLKTRLQENYLGYMLESLKVFNYQSEHYAILPLLHDTHNLTCFLPKDTLVFWPEGMFHKAKAYAHLLDESAEQKGIEPRHFGLESLKAALEPFEQVRLNQEQDTPVATLLPPITKNLNQMTATLHNHLKDNYKVVVVTPQPQRIVNILRERDCPVSVGEHHQDGAVWVQQGALPEGFAYAPNRVLCFTDRELFQEQGHVTRKSKMRRKPSPLQLSQLKPEMLVVHDVHGIGRYQGLIQYKLGGQVREYLEIFYHGQDRLLVPVDQMNRLQVYHGVGGKTVKLSKMGGSDWERTRSKVKKALLEMAEELLRTEAERQQAEGYAARPDTEWQKEMEFAFPYEETPDQLRAIQETKWDMEQPLPMNRLICGDVGFGKTEVALRAAFKAAASGLQVALLAPTTILAHQHFQTLKDRFSAYPIRVELLSRYKTPKESKQVFEDLKAGAIDIVVATHRLLSKQLGFKQLGLLIIDEEHRFGVAQKEKLKKIQPNIDILTMSATPIPRTLNIAMGGLKALSLIETPPPNRQPIQTIVKPYQPELIQKAIYHELQRGGQVYYIHNRVKDIEDVGAKVQELVPQAKVRVAHGQMSKQELERTMWDFYHHVFDILVCTTIVESGLDISNVNTLIIENVELLGLAQIHQLRGRVGRSNIQAYAYMFYNKHKPLTKEATQRLGVVQEYTQLGSGYYLALKDMEIRGIGNIIGPQQHGNIISVGFDTYCQLLEEAIAQLKGEKGERALIPKECVIDLVLPAYIPDQWIKDEHQKMVVYRALAYAHSLEYLAELKDQNVKRHGDIPRPAETLWRITQARLQATDMGIERVGVTGPHLEIQVKLKESTWIKAKKKNPELKVWKYSETGLKRPVSTSALIHLSQLEEVLDALAQVGDFNEEELLVHV